MLDVRILANPLFRACNLAWIVTMFGGIVDDLPADAGAAGGARPQRARVRTDDVRHGDRRDDRRPADEPHLQRRRPAAHDHGRAGRVRAGHARADADDALRQPVGAARADDGPRPRLRLRPRAAAGRDVRADLRPADRPRDGALQRDEPGRVEPGRRRRRVVPDGPAHPLRRPARQPRDERAASSAPSRMPSC